MAEFLIELGGSSVRIASENQQAADYLRLLFPAACKATARQTDQARLLLVEDKTLCRFLLREGEGMLFCGRLGVRCAAVLYDRVIYHLLNHNRAGLGLHAGAVAVQGKTVLLPGRSGSGKSTLTAWFTARGYSYLTDELVFLSESSSAAPVFFSRPICIKPGAAAAVKSFLPPDSGTVLEDEDGLLVAPRSLGADDPVPAALPALILLPNFDPASPLRLERISDARACTSLMPCVANGRNLESHGFKQIARLVRSIPTYSLNYSSFAGLAQALDQLASRGGDSE